MRYIEKDGIRWVRCNWCESEFWEDNIINRYSEDPEAEELCPVCGKGGYLMDIEAEEEEE